MDYRTSYQAIMESYLEGDLETARKRAMELPVLLFRRFLLEITLEEQEILYGEIASYQTLTDTNFQTILLGLSPQIRVKLLQDKTIAKRVLLLPKNKMKHHMFQLLDSESQAILLEHGDLFLSLEETQLKEFLCSLKETQRLELIHSMQEKLSDSTKLNPCYDWIQASHHNVWEPTRTMLQKSFPKAEESITNLMVLLKRKQREPFTLLLLDHELSLSIYEKFNYMIFDTTELEKSPCLPLLDHINKKNFTQLLHLQPVKEGAGQEHFMEVLTCYCMFGYDNARKVLLGNFSTCNVPTMKKVAELQFTNERREYRLSHQNEFYSNNLVSMVEGAFVEVSSGRFLAMEHPIFQLLLQSSNPEDYDHFYSQLEKAIYAKNYQNDLLSSKESVTNLIKNVIKDRENKRKHQYVDQAVHRSSQLPTCTNDFYSLFKNFDFRQVTLDEKGNPVLDPKLTEFLLGNEKRNNDCLLRICLTQPVMNIDDLICDIVNKFPLIKEQIMRPGGGTLSIHSLIDVIEVYKAISYTLDYDEQDLSLATLAKLTKSKEYCINALGNPFQDALALHKQQLKRVASSIPYVKGETKDHIKYQVMPFQDESLIAIGISTGCCFKVGAKGETFLNYCLLNPNGAILSLWDEENQLYICPLIRNGNLLLGNGLDPDSADPSRKEDLIKAIQEAYTKMASLSNEREKIEIGVLGDYHIKDSPSFQQLPFLQFDQTPTCEQEDFYSDFTKPNVRCHFLLGNEQIPIKSYVPRPIYYQPREECYCINQSNIIDYQEKKEYEKCINSIAYRSIDELKITKKQKNQMKRMFVPYQLEKFQFLFGNTDWFIGVYEDGYVQAILPYDKRAFSEASFYSQFYQEAIGKVR